MRETKICQRIGCGNTIKKGRMSTYNWKRTRWCSAKCRMENQMRLAKSKRRNGRSIFGEENAYQNCIPSAGAREAIKEFLYSMSPTPDTQEVMA